jgi:hypothetical protein
MISEMLGDFPKLGRSEAMVGSVPFVPLEVNSLSRLELTKGFRLDVALPVPFKREESPLVSGLLASVVPFKLVPLNKSDVLGSESKEASKEAFVPDVFVPLPKDVNPPSRPELNSEFKPPDPRPLDRGSLVSIPSEFVPFIRSEDVGSDISKDESKVPNEAFVDVAGATLVVLEDPTD